MSTIHNKMTMANIGLLMQQYGIKASSLPNLLKYMEDVEALVKENETNAYELGYKTGLEVQLNTIEG